MSLKSQIPIQQKYKATVHQFYTFRESSNLSEPLGLTQYQPIEVMNIGKSNVNIYGTLNITGNMLPSSCNVYDLGSSNYRFRDLYLSGNTIDLGGTLISRNNITGGVTITTKSTNNPLDFSAKNIYTTGDIGIGTANPTQKLHIEGNIFTKGNITCSNINVIGDFVTLNTITSNTEQVVIENAGTGPALKVTQTGNNSVAEFYDKESGIALYVGNNGNIGIGTTNPQYTLDVNGNVYLGTSGSSLAILGCLYPIILGGALSDETTALATTNKLQLYAPYNLNVRSLKLPKFTINTAATSTITLDITKNGTTIYSSKPTITTGNKYSTNGTLTTNPTPFSENDEIIALVFTAGTGGTGAKVYIYCT